MGVAKGGEAFRIGFSIVRDLKIVWAWSTCVSAFRAERLPFVSADTEEDL